MIDRRLLAYIPSTKKYIYLNVLAQWISLLANIVIMYTIAKILAKVKVERKLLERHRKYRAKKSSKKCRANQIPGLLQLSDFARHLVVISPVGAAPDRSLHIHLFAS